MFRWRHETPCLAALVIATLVSGFGTMAPEPEAHVGAMTSTHSSQYLRCVNYTRNATQECRTDQRRNNRSVRPCRILKRSYTERCQAA